MIKHCQQHTGLSWHTDYYTQCPQCEVRDNIKYSYLLDLRGCAKHNRIVVFDKDYGCPVCKIEGKADPSKTPTREQTVDIKIDELEDQAKDIIAARAERQLEKTGDHGRPDEGGAGYRWL